MIPEEVRVIAENLVHDMRHGLKPQSDEAARKWLALARRKYPQLEAVHVPDTRKLPARAV